MANSNVELDLFGIHHHNNNHHNSIPPTPRPRLDRRQSFQGISKINPEIVKSVIASASKHGPPESGSKKVVSQPGSPRVGATQLPVFQPLPFLGPGSNVKAEETSPMTIFYNGTVSVFDLPKHEADSIIKIAIEKNFDMSDEHVVDHTAVNSETTDDILGSLNDGDMPIKRKKSLQRFFEKRKERLTSVSPYYMLDDDVAPIYRQKN